MDEGKLVDDSETTFLTASIVSIIFSPILLDTSIVTELDPLTFAYDCLSSKVLFIFAISLNVITESPDVLIGVLRTSSIFSKRPHLKNAQLR